MAAPSTPPTILPSPQLAPLVSFVSPNHFGGNLGECSTEESLWATHKLLGNPVVREFPFSAAQESEALDCSLRAKNQKHSTLDLISCLLAGG